MCKNQLCETFVGLCILSFDSGFTLEFVTLLVLVRYQNMVPIKLKEI